MTAVFFRGTRYAAKQLAYRLVSMLTGRAPDSLGLARGVFSTIGYAALSDIKDDFVRKASGQQGEDGATWPKLSPKTIAARRFGPKDKKLPHIAGRLAAEKAARAEISATDRALRKKQKAAIKARLLLSLPADEAEKQASKLMVANLKRRGSLKVTRYTKQTRVDVFSQRQVEILRDTGVLLNSLSPGEISGDGRSVSYVPPHDDGGEDQVFRLFDSGVIVGTSVPYGLTHQEGDATRKIPARPFLPTRGVPRAWAERWAEAGCDAVQAAARIIYEQGAVA